MTTPSTSGRRRNRIHLAKPLLLLVVGLEVLFLVGPIAITLVLSFSKARILVFPPDGFSLHWYTNVIHSEQWTGAALNSLEISGSVMVLSALLGAPAAYALVRCNVKLRQFVTGMVLLPLVTPLILLALGYAIMLLPRGYAATPEGLIFAQTAITVPYMVLNCMVGLQGIPLNVEAAAASLGAGKIRTFAEVTLPLMKRGLLAGAIFAFLTSWDDATVVLFITGPHLTTLPIYLLTTIQDDLNPEVAAVAGYLFMLVLLLAAAVVLTGGVRGVGRPMRKAESTSRTVDESVASDVSRVESA